MKKTICLLLAALMLFGLAACGPKKVTEEPDMNALLTAYVQEKTAQLREEFGMDDLEIKLEDNASVKIKTARETEEDIGEYDYYVPYYIYAPDFVEDLLSRQVDRALTFDDILLGDQLSRAFTMDDFSVENYVVGQYASEVCTCRGIIGDAGDTELTFEEDPDGEFNFGTITKRWNFTDDAYEWDMIFYYSEKHARAYFSQAEYDENALPPTLDEKGNCSKCGRYAMRAANGYCKTCVNIYTKDWYIDWDGQVSIDGGW